MDKGKGLRFRQHGHSSLVHQHKGHDHDRGRGQLVCIHVGFDILLTMHAPWEDETRWSKGRDPGRTSHRLPRDQHEDHEYLNTHIAFFEEIESFPTTQTNTISLLPPPTPCHCCNRLTAPEIDSQTANQSEQNDNRPVPTKEEDILYLLPLNTQFPQGRHRTADLVSCSTAVFEIQRFV